MSDRYEALTKVIYSQIAFRGGSDEHFESVRGGMYDDAARAVVEFLTSDEAVTRGIDFLVKHRELIGRDAMRAALLAAVGGSDE